ncbi:MAG: hypothetical protein NWE93_00770 [Candidatus Bathyarchaeota archaeon]|nr:hypothetical protein [Candidatus Bathyarchaeota archaeon]
MVCKLQAFRRDAVDSNMASSYRFAVVDSSKAKEYPANFVCMLPVKVEQGKGKTVTVFGEIFGEKSIELALDLLKSALENESDMAIKAELNRRIKLIDPKQANLVKCNGCSKTFQPRRVRKYKQNFCDDCLKAKYGIKH